MFRSRGFLAFLAVSVPANTSLFSYISGSPFLYQDQLGLSSIAYGLVFGVNAISMTVMTLIADRPLRRWSHPWWGSVTRRSSRAS